MTLRLVMLVVTAQLADLATMGLALRRDPTGEANPAMVALLGWGGFGVVALAKVAAIVALLVIMARLRSRRLALFVAAVGIFGAATNVVGMA